MSGAQIFGQMGGNLLGGGEAGQEAVLPLSDFYDHLDGILSRYMNNTASGLVVQLNIERSRTADPKTLKRLPAAWALRCAAKWKRNGGLLSD